MARISFMKKFPDGTPTYFMEKVQNSIGCISKFGAFTKLSALSPKDASALLPKIHTIREDKKGHWRSMIGKSIECFYWNGNAYRSAHDVWGTVKIVSIQHIKIDWNEPMRTTKPSIYIDGRGIGRDNYLSLSINDGFNDFNHFAQYFKEDFNGYILHFTNLKY